MLLHDQYHPTHMPTWGYSHMVEKDENMAVEDVLERWGKDDIEMPLSGVEIEINRILKTLIVIVATLCLEKYHLLLG